MGRPMWGRQFSHPSNPSSVQYGRWGVFLFDTTGYPCDNYIMKNQKPILNISEIYPYSWKLDDYIVQNVKHIVANELRYCDPNDEACCESARDNLEEIITSLTLLKKEVDAHTNPSLN